MEKTKILINGEKKGVYYITTLSTSHGIYFLYSETELGEDDAEIHMGKIVENEKGIELVSVPKEDYNELLTKIKKEVL